VRRVPPIQDQEEIRGNFHPAVEAARGKKFFSWRTIEGRAKGLLYSKKTLLPRSSTPWRRSHRDAGQKMSARLGSGVPLFKEPGRGKKKALGRKKKERGCNRKGLELRAPAITKVASRNKSLREERSNSDRAPELPKNIELKHYRIKRGKANFIPHRVSGPDRNGPEKSMRLGAHHTHRYRKTTSRGLIRHKGCLKS